MLNNDVKTIHLFVTIFYLDITFSRYNNLYIFCRYTRFDILFGHLHSIHFRFEFGLWRWDLQPCLEHYFLKPTGYTSSLEVINSTERYLNILHIFNPREMTNDLCSTGA